MTQVVRTQVCVAGGGPAGMVHALLLARAGIDVTVLEKHNDFLRDFRGDTVHPSTLRVMDELGLIDEFLRLPHTKVTRLAFNTDGTLRTFGNFSALSRLGFKQPYIALMPQWDFLDFLAEKASAYPEFTLGPQRRGDGSGRSTATVSSACAPQNSRCAPILSSAPTDANPQCAPRPVCRSGARIRR